MDRAGPPRLCAGAVQLVPLQLRLGRDTDRPDAQAVDLDRRAVASVVVGALVLGMEPVDRVGEVGGRRDGNRQRTPLTEVAHVDETLHRHLLLRYTLRLEPLACLALELLELAFERVPADAVHIREG